MYPLSMPFTRLSRIDPFLPKVQILFEQTAPILQHTESKTTPNLLATVQLIPPSSHSEEKNHDLTGQNDVKQ